MNECGEQGTDESPGLERPLSESSAVLRGTGALCTQRGSLYEHNGQETDKAAVEHEHSHPQTENGLGDAARTGR